MSIALETHYGSFVAIFFNLRSERTLPQLLLFPLLSPPLHLPLILLSLLQKSLHRQIHLIFFDIFIRFTIRICQIKSNFLQSIIIIFFVIKRLIILNDFHNTLLHLPRKTKITLFFPHIINF